VIAPEGETADERRWTVGRVAAVSVVVLFLAGWVWLISAQAGLPVPWAPGDNPDRLQDRKFAEAAEARCAIALVRIATIPTAREAETPQDRAGQVASGTVEFEAMVIDLRALALEIDLETERDILAKWFADWDRYIDDRWSHVDRLEAADAETSGRDLAFVLSSDVVGSGIYTERLDGFARVNDMDSCVVPGDV
jgi:hypothetical protein